MNRPVPAAVEQTLVAQGKAVPLLAEALLRWQEDADRDLLWLIVLLGQSRSPSAVDPLVRHMCRTDQDMLAQAGPQKVAGRPGPAGVCPADLSLADRAGG